MQVRTFSQAEYHSLSFEPRQLTNIKIKATKKFFETLTIF